MFVVVMLTVVHTKVVAIPCSGAVHKITLHAYRAPAQIFKRGKARLSILRLCMAQSDHTSQMNQTWGQACYSKVPIA